MPYWRYYVVLAMRIILLSYFFILLTFGCDSSQPTTKPERLTNGPKNGEWINRRTDGTIKTRVIYKNGIKHGVSTLFHPDGKTVQLAMPYKNGKRHGTSQKFFNNGQLYAETSYEDDMLHGSRKTYYRSGKLQSSITYSHGQPFADLKEYFKSGNEKDQPELKYVRFGNFLNITVDNELCKSPEFFLGNFPANAPFPGVDALTLLPTSGNETRIDLSVYTPSYLSVQDLVCKCTSSQGNPLILKKRLEL
jgi:hypothetical protein